MSPAKNLDGPPQDMTPILENRKLDAKEQPLSDRLQVSALSLAQRGLIYDARQSA
jgi:hypothetical protein